VRKGWWSIRSAPSSGVTTRYFAPRADKGARRVQFDGAAYNLQRAITVRCPPS
jgi:hypothetical protein